MYFIKLYILNFLNLNILFVLLFIKKWKQSKVNHLLKKHLENVMYFLHVTNISVSLSLLGFEGVNSLRWTTYLCRVCLTPVDHQVSVTLQDQLGLMVSN